jgi:hypothetical protein
MTRVGAAAVAERSLQSKKEQRTVLDGTSTFLRCVKVISLHLLGNNVDCGSLSVVMPVLFSIAAAGSSSEDDKINACLRTLFFLAAVPQISRSIHKTPGF